MEIATRFEYLFLLLVWCAAGGSILWPQFRTLRRARYFWVSAASFVMLGAIVDWIAISQAWWEWSDQRTCGVRLGAIPIEEYLGFFIGHALAVAGWEALDDLA